MSEEGRLKVRTHGNYLKDWQGGRALPEAGLPMHAVSVTTQDRRSATMRTMGSARSSGRDRRLTGTPKANGDGGAP